jgi:predicted RNase H-like HicB family nuclease
LSSETLAYYEAIPYLLVMESIERDGQWVRRAEYPELGCVVEADDAVEAFERLEHARRRLLRERFDQGAPIPVPRPPLRDR